VVMSRAICHVRINLHDQPIEVTTKMSIPSKWYVRTQAYQIVFSANTGCDFTPSSNRWLAWLALPLIEV